MSDQESTQSQENPATEKPPIWFTVANIIILIWNVLGMLAFVMDCAMVYGGFGLEELPVEQKELYESRPIWVTIAFALATIGGTIAAVGLVLKKSWAFPVLLASLAGVLLQQLYIFVLSDSIEVMGGPTAAIFPVVIILISMGLVPYSRMAVARGWLN
ncbi:MAG: hypothetical protein AAF483_06940 [Planctomycetota bacterium]